MESPMSLCEKDPLEVDDHIDITGFSLVLELSYPFDDSRVFMDDDDSEVTLFSSILMQETATKIESFPFKNNSLETIHNVVISSSLAKNVESARLSIRDRVPIEYIIGCRCDKVDSLGKILLEAHFSATFNVKLSFTLIAEDACYQACIRGYRYRFDLLRKAVVDFCHLLQTPSESVEMAIRVSDLHMSLIRNCIPLVENNSGARVRCPTESNLVLLRGSLETTYFASEMLAGLAPMRLKTILSPSVEICRIRLIARQMDIAVSVLKEESGFHTLELTSFEWNARFLYELGRIANGVDLKFSVFPEEQPLWTNLSDSPYTFLSVANSKENKES